MDLYSLVGYRIRIEFSEAEKQALHFGRFHYPHALVQKKMEAVVESQGLAHQEISRLARVNGNTVVRYLHE